MCMGYIAHMAHTYVEEVQVALQVCIQQYTCFLPCVMQTEVLQWVISIYPLSS